MNGQTALQELRARFEKDLALKVKLLDVTTDSLIIYSFTGEIIYINNAGCRMRGYSREEIFKLNLTDLIAPGYVDFARQQIEILKTKGFAEFEINQKRRDGSEFITEVRSSIIEVDNEKLIMGFAHDITERKKMENELRESEERFRNFALLSPVGIFLTDAQGHYQYVNKRWCEISGLSPLEASGEGWLKGLVPDDRERIRAAWNQFIQTDGKWIAEFRFRDQSAKVTWVHSIVTPLHDEQGKVTGFLGTNADINESKIADEKSRKAQDELQTIFDSSPAMIFYKDKNNIMVRVNKAYAETLELTPDKINGRSTAEFFPANAEKYWHDDLQVINTGIPLLNIIEPMETKRGLRTVRTDKIPYRDEKGNVIGVIGFVLDITERKQAEEELQRSQKQLKEVTSGIPGLVYEFRITKDEVMDFPFVSGNTRELFETDPEEFKKDFTLIWNMVLPEDVESLRQSILTVTRKKEPWAHEFRVKIPDGTIKTLLGRSRIVNCQDDGTTIFAGTLFDITEQKQAEEERNSLAKFPAEDPFPVLRIARDGKILYANKASLVVHEKWQTSVGGVVPKQWLELIEKAFESHQVEIAEEEANGQILSFAIMPIAEAGYVNLYGNDITERKRFEAAKRVSAEILEVLNLTEPQENYIQKILAKIKTYTGIEAVGIRLHEGDDYPYIEYSGFPEHFITKENYLCSCDQAGALVRDAQGHPYLECMCGNIICGRTDAGQPFFTKGGSFWTNSSTELLATTTEADRQARTRNQCNKEGYESVAMIPLRSNEGIIGLLQLNDHFKGKFSLSLIEFLEGIGASIGIALKRKQAEERLKESLLKLQKTLEGTINALAVTTENRDPYTAGHQRRVADLAFHIGLEMGLSEEQVQGLKLAGLIHDIGKISIPMEILNKPGKLSEAEFTLIKGHSQVGYDILKNIEFAWPIAKIVLQHHERINGSGYPAKISDGDILLESKIISVADVIEAMASDRPYRPALGIDTALAEVNQKKGQLYDSQVVDVCNKIFKEKGYRFA